MAYPITAFPAKKLSLHVVAQSERIASRFARILYAGFQQDHQDRFWLPVWSPTEGGVLQQKPKGSFKMCKRMV
jgi:hypothetical protein